MQFCLQHKRLVLLSCLLACNICFATTLQHKEKRPTIIVIGAGGAGMAAAIQATHTGGKVIVLEKAARIGGNTQYAAGGINAANTVHQQKLGIKDSPELVYQDTMRSGKYLNNPKLVRLLANDSQATFNWLIKMGANLPVVTRMGGATVSRAHRPKGGLPVGLVIVRALADTASKLHIDIRTNSKAIKLLTSNKRVVGVKVQPKNGSLYNLYAKAVIITTGGFAANNKMVSHYRPDLAQYKTTNPSTATGDGIKLAVPIGAALVDMKQIQLHPTVAVPSAGHPGRRHILLTEALRGLGGILINKSGNRFVDELQTRDVVSRAEIKQPGHIAYLIFDQQVAHRFSAAVNFYLRAKVLHKANSWHDLAAILGVNATNLTKTVARYNRFVTTKNDKDYHRKHMPLLLQKPPFFGAKTMPAVHYCMGGLEINTNAQVINHQGLPIPGLYAAGEVTGGIHGANRSGGNSLLGIITFGRIAALNAVKYAKTATTTVRKEKDSLGTKLIGHNKYYGIQTLRATENFPVTGIKLSQFPLLIKALATVKEAVTIVNKQQGTLKPEIADAIIKAAQRIQRGEFNDQFPVDIIQGGAGTSIHMNINEVIANIALESFGHKKGNYRYVHPNNHVNAAQSTNDVYPTAGKIALVWYCQKLIPALEALRDAFYVKSRQFHNIIKIGRTHLQDAVPITLEQEFHAFGTTINDEIINLKSAVKTLYSINIGATAVGTGMNTKHGHSNAVITTLKKLTGIPLVKEPDLIEATSDAGSYVRVADALKSIAIKLTKVANDLRLLSSGPVGGLGDISLPAIQPGSSIMPGKINPVIPEVINQISFEIIGNSQTVDLAAAAGQLQLNVFLPVIFYNLIKSTNLLTQGCKIMRTKCIEGIKANTKRIKAKFKYFAGVATALSPYIGYNRAAAIVKESIKTKTPIEIIIKKYKLLPPEKINKILSPTNLTKPNVPHDKQIGPI